MAFLLFTFANIIVLYHSIVSFVMLYLFRNNDEFDLLEKYLLSQIINYSGQILKMHIWVLIFSYGDGPVKKFL